MKKIIGWFIDNHVSANLMMLFVLAAGIITVMTMKVEVFPDITPDKIAITVVDTGASPAEIEESIVNRIEERISGLEGIDEINSTAREGLATIIVDVMKGWNKSKLLDDIKTEVDSITSLPDEAEKPVIRELTRSTQVIFIAVYGDAQERTIKHVAENIKDDITSIEGVSLATLYGVRTEEIHIDIPEENLRRYRLSLPQVASIIRASAIDLPAGSIKTKSEEILIRSKGRRYHADEYRDIPIITDPDGSVVALGDIAELREGFEDTDIYARFNGKPAAIIQVYRVGEQNALDVAKKVKTYIDGIRPGLPKGLNIDTFSDMSSILKSRINLLLKNMAFGMILVVITLGVFLNWRLAGWISLGIPIAFATGLWLLPSFGVSINMVSLFAFIMVLGIVVDDAIVIGENVFRLRQRGIEAREASVEGTYNVAKAVVFSVLTTIAAFWPLLMASGVMGRIMRNIPIVVILVLSGSLLEALLILPVHLARTKVRPEYAKKKVDRLVSRFIDGPYARFIGFSLRWRYVTFAVFITVAFITIGAWKGGVLKFTFFPEVEGDVMTCNLTMPAGTSAEHTAEVAGRIEKAARIALKKKDLKRPEGSEPLFKYSVSLIGVQMPGHGPRGGEAMLGSNLAQIMVQLLEGEKRGPISADTLASLWRKQTGLVPEAENISFTSEIFSAGMPIDIDLSMKDNNKLVSAVDALKEELSKYPGVFDINDSFVPGKEEMRLRLKPSGKALGLSLGDIASQVRGAFYGSEALRIQRGKDEVKVLVRYPDKERQTLTSIEDMRVHTKNGLEIPFKEVADVKTERGYTTIRHHDLMRIIEVYADVDESIANANELRHILMSKIMPRLKDKYPDLRYAMAGEGKEQKESMVDVEKGMILAFFLIYVLLAVPFNSFTQPFIIMMAIPFGIVGAFWGHMIMGYNLSILSVFGIVGLAGVVVNDALVLTSEINKNMQRGTDMHEAIVSGGKIRFRAVILTTLTTFFGLTPMITERSLQARFLVPMAISLGFGVLFSTFITLILVPCMYAMLEDLKAL
ncbi:MAG: efflux RND transporter permease subunit, partial [Deltaproteobacteria bacterium]|nr:efflux RND transporter permease subunit [Deltaproteobacteria bacterium]